MITIKQHNQVFTPAPLVSISETAEIYLGDDLLCFPDTPPIEFLEELDAELSNNDVRSADFPAFVDFITEVNGFYLLTSDEAGARVSEFLDSYQGWFESECAFMEYCYNNGMYPFNFGAGGADKLLPKDSINFDVMARFAFWRDFTRTSRGYVFCLF